MGFDGKFDEETGTVYVSGAGMDLESLGRAIKWMNGVRQFLTHRQMVDDGGIRWEFQRGDVPTARYVKGKVTWVQPFPLVLFRPRKPRKCASCGIDIEASESCWKAAPGGWSGHSRDRFCARCVERGAAPRPPKLRLVV